MYTALASSWQDPGRDVLRTAGTPLSSSQPGRSATPRPPAKEKEDDITEEHDQPSIWSPYVCSTLDYGAEHPGKLVEASVLAAVDLPQASFPLKDSLQAIIDMKTLSRMQLEGVAYACQRHCETISGGMRAGFYLGDSAGVGKGRQISAIIFDSLVRGRKRHCWFSVSSDLHLDATRDLRDIGCNVSVFSSIAELENATPEQRNRPGVLFSTYSSLISKGRVSKGKTRFDELVEWLSEDKSPVQFDGVLVFDESHKAKNFRENEATTLTGKAVHKLQEVFPKARVVYSSATCVSSVDDMQYMTRLGYWGSGCVYDSFERFRTAIARADVTGMELLAVDMKSTGRAVVRNVSYEDATFKVATADLGLKHATLYRMACKLWIDTYHDAMSALEVCYGYTEEEARAGMGAASDDEDAVDEVDEEAAAADAPKIARTDSNDYLQEVLQMYRTFKAQYWGSHQRFFGQLMLSFKIDKVVEEVRAELANGKCAVIGLQSTGEAALMRALETEGLDIGVRSDNIVSVSKSIAKHFLRTQFKVKRGRPPQKDVEYPFYVPSEEEIRESIKQVCVAKNIHIGQKKVLQKIFSYVFDKGLDEKRRSIEWPMFRKNGDVIEALRMRDRLLERVEHMDLPPCALDDLLDKLGGPDAVAEMTGRTVRQLRTPEGDFCVETRVAPGCKADKSSTREYVSKAKWWADASTHTDSLNVHERTAFMQGTKLVAIISAASSTGVSLHADRKVKNQRQRFHVTLELPWAADQAIQQLGRSHRTNQATAPLFCLMSSGLGAENRFVSSVARRLQSLGALTQGDRRASLGASVIGDMQLESDHGLRALVEMMKPFKEMDLPLSQRTSLLVTSSRGVETTNASNINSNGAGNANRAGDTSNRSDNQANSTGDDNAPQDPDRPRVFQGVDWKQVLEESKDVLQLDRDACQSLSNSKNLDSEFLTLTAIQSEEDFLNSIRDGLLALMMKRAKAVKSSDSASGTTKPSNDKKKAIARFLNRLLGLPFAHQTLLFNYFVAILDLKLKEADRGFLTFSGKIMRLRKPSTVYKDNLGRAVLLEYVRNMKQMNFWELIKEIRFLVRSISNPSLTRDDFAVEPLSSNALTVLLEDADKHGIEFFLSKNPEHIWSKISCTRGVASNGVRYVMTPVFGFAPASVKASELTEKYAKITDVNEIKRIWTLIHEKALKKGQGQDDLYIATGSLIPVLEIAFTSEYGDLGSGEIWRQKLKCYVGKTVDGERLLGILITNKDRFIQMLETKQRLERTMKIKLGSIPLQDLIQGYNFGFDIDSRGYIVQVMSKGSDFQLEKGFRLIRINDVRFQETSEVQNIQDAIRFWVLNMRTKSQTTMAIDFEILGDDRQLRAQQQFATEQPAKVIHSIINELTHDPNKVRKSIERREKKLRKYFLSSDDEDEAKEAERRARKKEKKALKAAAAATTNASKRKREEEGAEEEDDYLARLERKSKEEMPSELGENTPWKTPGERARETKMDSQSGSAASLVDVSSASMQTVKRARFEQEEDQIEIVSDTPAGNVVKKLEFVASSTRVTSESVKEIIEIDDDDILEFDFRLKRKPKLARPANQ